MNKGSLAFKHTIKEYLENRGSKDPLFGRIITKPGKNIDDCIIYIINTVQKTGYNGFTDDEIYNMAIHYFDEDDIKVGSLPSNMKIVVNHKVELTEEDKAEAKEKAMNELIARETETILKNRKKEEEKKIKHAEKKAEKAEKANKTLF